MRSAAMAAQLIRCRRHHGRLATTDPEWKIGSEEEARRIQDLLAEGMGEAVAGWKLGALDEPAQRRLNLSKPFIGRVFQSRLWTSPAVLSSRHLGGCRVEVEIAVRLEKDLARRDRPYGGAEIASAISGYHAAIEVIELSWRTPEGLSGFDIVADNGGCFGLVVGPGTRAFESKGQRVELRVDGELAAETTIDEDIASLLERVAWLANHLIERGFRLEAGQFVATGTWTGMTPLGRGQTAGASIAPLGAIEMALG